LLFRPGQSGELDSFPIGRISSFRSAKPEFFLTPENVADCTPVLLLRALFLAELHPGQVANPSGVFLASTHGRIKPVQYVKVE
jgi:hypothetical protein